MVRIFTTANFDATALSGAPVVDGWDCCLDRKRAVMLLLIFLAFFPGYKLRLWEV